MEVIIGTGIKFVGDYTFYGCSALLDVYCYSESVPETSSNAFTFSYPDKITLHVPASSVELYKYKSPWVYFKEVVALTDQEVSVYCITKDNMTEVALYTTGGQRVNQNTKGLNIVRMSDGTTKKVIVK